MSSNVYREQPSAPPMQFVGASGIPMPPERFDCNRYEQQAESLLPPPKVPQRMDKPATPRRPESRRSTGGAAETALRQVDNEEKTGETNNSGACNVNRYATKKTVGTGLLALALLTSNAMQLRTLILQKHHDNIWIASLALVCISILFHMGLVCLLFVIGKEDIRNVQKQVKLERLNTVALLIIVVVTIMNVVINVFMLTINPRSFLDGRTLALLEQQRP